MYEDCRARALLRACNCVPLEYSGYQVEILILLLLLPFPQEMRKCSPEERDCIANKSTSTFNCRFACERMYADVQWKETALEEPVEDEVEKKVNDMYADESTMIVFEILKRELLKGGRKGQKFKKLMSENRQFKKDQVQHFRFDSATPSTGFGKYIPLQIKTKTNETSGEKN